MTKLHLALLTFALLFSNFSQAKDWVYVVVKGDNLWDIAKTHLNQIQYYKDIKRLNNIEQPRRMQPGTVLRIPLDWVTRNAAKVSIIHISGTHQLLRNKELSQININDEFQLGDELRVSNSGNLTVKFADGSEMTLSKGVIVRFDHLTQYGKSAMVDTRIRLNQGKIEIRAEKQTGVASRLDIDTASAVTSVRGTIFRVSVDSDDNSSSVVEVLEGEVAVTKGSNLVSVKQGYAVKVNEQEAIGSQIQLPPAPKIIPFHSFISKLDYQIKWLPLGEAQSYQYQIANDANISKPIYEQKTTKPLLTLPKLENGNYYLRLTAINKVGIEGLPTVKPFTVGVTPTLSIKVPKLKGVSNEDGQYVTWKLGPEQKFVELQVSTEKDFTDAKDIRIDGEAKYQLNIDTSVPVKYVRARSRNSQDLHYSAWSKPCKISSNTKMILCGI